MSWDSSTPTTSDCGNQIDDVSSDGSSNADHAVMQFDVADNVPRNAQVLEAQLGATVGYNSSSSTQQVGLYQVTHSWTQSATWNAYDGSNAWSTPGGDTASTPAATTAIQKGTTQTAYWEPSAGCRAEWTARSPTTG